RAVGRHVNASMRAAAHGELHPNRVVDPTRVWPSAPSTPYVRGMASPERHAAYNLVAVYPTAEQARQAAAALDAAGIDAAHVELIDRNTPSAASNAVAGQVGRRAAIGAAIGGVVGVLVGVVIHLIATDNIVPEIVGLIIGLI